MASTLLVLSKEEAHGTRTGITTRKKYTATPRRTQQRRKGNERKDDFKTKNRYKLKKTGFFLIEKTANMKHTSRLNYMFFFFFFFLDFVSNKMSYVRIIICIIYNIQCLRRLRKIPLTNNTDV